MKFFALASIIVILTLITGCAAIKPRYYQTEETFIDTQSNTMWVKKVVNKANGFDGGYRKISGALFDDGDASRYDYFMAEKKINDINEQNYAGYSDWRLPTRLEIQAIVEIGKNNINATQLSTGSRRTVKASLVELGFFVNSKCWLSDGGNDKNADLVYLDEISSVKSLQILYTNKNVNQGGVCPVRTYTETISK